MGGMAGACRAWCRCHPWSCRGAVAGNRRQPDRDRASRSSITILVGAFHAVDRDRRLLRHRQDTRHRRQQACPVPDRKHPQEPGCRAAAPTRHQVGNRQGGGEGMEGRSRGSGPGQSATATDAGGGHGSRPVRHPAPLCFGRHDRAACGAAAGPAARHAADVRRACVAVLEHGPVLERQRQGILARGLERTSTTWSSAWAGLRS